MIQNDKFMLRVDLFVHSAGVQQNDINIGGDDIA